MAHTIGQALPWTLVLVGVTTILAFIIGTLLGVYAGWRRGKAADTSVTLGATFFAAFPPFWLGLLLLYVFAFKLTGGRSRAAYTPADTQLNLTFLGDAARHSILPALTLAITSLSGWVFGMRNNMINTLGEDYVTFAEANGCAPAPSPCSTPRATRCCPTSPRSGCRWERSSADRSWSRACSAIQASATCSTSPWPTTTSL